MKKFTFVLLFILIISQAFASGFRSEGNGKLILSELLRKQNQSGLRSFYPNMNMGAPDSSVVHSPGGEPIYKCTYTFSAGEMIIEGQKWDYGWLRWGSVLDKEYIYFDENGNDTTSMAYEYGLDGWIITEKTLCVFNENDVEETIYSYQKNYRDDIWKTIDTLDVSSILVAGSQTLAASQIYFLANEGNQIPDKRFDYEYSNNVIQSYIFYVPNNAYGWTPARRYICNRNEKGELLSIDYYAWDKVANNWPEEWEFQETFYYPGSYTGSNPASLSDTRVWSSDQMIYIESATNLASVSIYSITGQLLYNQTAKGNVMVMESPVKKGIYIVKVKDMNGETTTTKTVIR